MLRPPALLILSALAATALWPAPAQAQQTPKGIAKAVVREVVFVHPRADPTLTEQEAGELRLRILDRKIGRIKIVVVPLSIADRAGGIATFANEVAVAAGSRGTLIAVAGPNIYASVSYPQAAEAVAALQKAVSKHATAGLARQLRSAVDRIARVDPGPRGDVQQQQQGAPPGARAPAPGFPAPPAGGDGGFGAIDDFFGALKLAVFIVVALIALPFITGAFFVWRRVRRGRAEAAEGLADARAEGFDRLVALGDEIRALDLDTSLPNADPVGKVAYEAALGAYERADRALARATTPARMAKAEALLNEGRSQIEVAKARFAGGSSAAGAISR